MDPLTAGLSIGSSLLNFFGGQSAQDKAIAAQERTNQQNWANSLYMAQNSIQMRKQDAEAAGIHPVYALGSPTMSFAPAQVGAAGQPQNRMAPLAQGMRDLGQSLTAAPGSQAAPNAYAAEAAALDLENRKLQNEILKNRVVAGRSTMGAVSQVPPSGNFVVPENPKVEQRPPLMMSGSRWSTSDKTSPMKAWEDQYGDEGPVSWGMPLMILSDDMEKNYGPMSSWPGQVMRWGANQLIKEVTPSNPFVRRLFSAPDSGVYRWHKKPGT